MSPTGIENPHMQEREQREIRAEVLRNLEALAGATFDTDEIVFRGHQLVLPETLRDIDEGIEFLQAKKVELDNVMEFSRKLNYRPFDVAYNGYRAFKRIFGAVIQRGGFLSPPQMIDIPIGVNEVTQVPWGNFQLPHLPEVTFAFGAVMDKEYGQVGLLQAVGPKKWSAAIQGIFNLVAEEVQAHSIYRGKAIDGQENPSFIATDIDRSTIVYAEHVMSSLEANLWGPIRHTEATRDLGLPLKRAILLEGDFGVGKTLALKSTGQECVESDTDWTFILVRPGRDDIEYAMQTAKIYAPAVVAFEDVDTVAGASEEANRISTMLDLFDGMDAKGKDVMVVLTTNHVEALHKGMLRPGRLDAIIQITSPDAAGIKRLIEVNAPKGSLDTDAIEWDRVTTAMEGYLPAFVVEATQRAVRYAVVRTNGLSSNVELTTADLEQSGLGLRPQYELMSGAVTHVSKPEVDRALHNLIDVAIQKRVDERILNDDE